MLRNFPHKINKFVLVSVSEARSSSPEPCITTMPNSLPNLCRFSYPHNILLLVYVSESCTLDLRLVFTCTQTQQHTQYTLHNRYACVQDRRHEHDLLCRRSSGHRTPATSSRPRESQKKLILLFGAHSHCFYAHNPTPWLKINKETINIAV